jgi:hypothetical protein
MSNLTNDEIADGIAAIKQGLIEQKIIHYHVGFGYKETNGVITSEEMAIRVYVAPNLPQSDRDKMKEWSLTRPDGSTQTIPVCMVDVIKDPPLAGSPTPVERLDLQSCGKEVESGIVISNDRGVTTGEPELGRGTLGFFARLADVTTPDNVVGVTNAHVLLYKYWDNPSAAKGKTVYRPFFSRKVGEVAEDFDGEKSRGNPIGTIGNLVMKDVPYEGKTYHVDCGIIKLIFDTSTNCKSSDATINYKNELRETKPDPNIPTAINGIAALKPADVQKPGGYKVYKVGARTGFTTGKVIDAAGVYFGTEKNVIVIEALDEDCNKWGGERYFSAHGDSGSALLNAQNQIVGILYAMDPRDPKRTYACHIHPVFAALQLRTESPDGKLPTAGPPPKANSTLLNASATVDGGQPDPVREGFLGSEQGRGVLGLYQKHRQEVVHLVNHCRPVTVVWHRNKGPAYLNRAIHAIRDPDLQLPREIDGVSRETLIRNMAQVLAEHGSEAMKELVANHLDEALAYVRGFDTVRELVDLLAAEKAQ